MRPAVLVFIVAAAACVVGHAAILVSVVRRASRVADAGVPRPKVAIEVAWAVLPLLVLAFVLTATWSRVREHAVAPADPVIKIAR